MQNEIVRIRVFSPPPSLCSTNVKKKSERLMLFFLIINISSFIE